MLVRLQDIRFPALPRGVLRRWLMYTEILFALIVLGTSAAVVSDFSTWSSCTTSTTSAAQYCTVINSSPQGFINIALFSSIIGFLFIGTLAIGEYIVRGEAAGGLPITRPTVSSLPSSRSMNALNSIDTAELTNSINRENSTLSHMDHKVLFVASLVFYPLLWIFWFTSVITTTILCDDTESKWHTLNASCAFTWLSWFATSGSCYLIGREVWELRRGPWSEGNKAGDRGRVAISATTNGSGLRRSADKSRSGRTGRMQDVQRTASGEPSLSAGSGPGSGSMGGRARNKARRKSRARERARDGDIEQNRREDVLGESETRNECENEHDNDSEREVTSESKSTSPTDRAVRV